MSDMFPRITPQKLTGNAGQTFFQHLIVNNFKWLYHPISEENDFGIDGYMEIVENGIVTGKLIGVQIKQGTSFFKCISNNKIVFEGEKKHINYYLNSSVPVIIVLMNDDYSKIIWTRFDINKTYPTKNGWKIEINQKQIDKSDVLKIITPAIDYSDEIKKMWNISELINSTGPSLFIIPQEDIFTLDYSKIQNYLHFIVKDSKMLRKKYQQFDIGIYGYDHDPRELYEIPEVVKWFKESMYQNIPWFYILSTDDHSAGLLLLACSLCNVGDKGIYNKKHKIIFYGEEFSRYLEMNYSILNQFMKENDLSLDLNKKICENIQKYFDNLRRILL